MARQPFTVAVGTCKASAAHFRLTTCASKRRIDRASVQFFLDWVNERIEQIHLADPDKQREVLEYHLRAHAFWEKRIEQAAATR